MKKLVLFGMLFLMFATSLDAAPRDRRRARRARRTAQPQCVNCNNAPAFDSAAVVEADQSLATLDELPTLEPAPSAQPQILLASGPTDVPLVVGQQAIAEAPTTVPAADAIAVVGDALPTVDIVATGPVDAQVLPSDVVPAPAIEPAPVNPALAELNMIRSRRGLFPLLEDRGLSLIARRKAAIQANRGYMGHPGGTMGGARFEGVGMGNQFTTCYQDATNARYAGAATVVGRNGRRYHCLLLR